jgi:hypothetical protein
MPPLEMELQLDKSDTLRCGVKSHWRNERLLRRDCVEKAWIRTRTRRSPDHRLAQAPFHARGLPEGGLKGWSSGFPVRLISCEVILHTPDIAVFAQEYKKRESTNSNAELPAVGRASCVSMVWR